MHLYEEVRLALKTEEKQTYLRYLIWVQRNASFFSEFAQCCMFHCFPWIQLSTKRHPFADAKPTGLLSKENGIVLQVAWDYCQGLEWLETE